MAALALDHSQAKFLAFEIQHDAEGFHQRFMRQHYIGRSDGDNPARQQHHLIAQLGFLYIMGRGDQAGSAIQLGPHGQFKQFFSSDIEPCGRFIKHQQISRPA
jgi:hypothetical protein